MRMKKFLAHEDGAVAVIVALSMTVLLGFASLVVDYGSLAATRRGAQNAADAAALAAASDLASKANLNAITATAKTYSAKNGYDDAGKDVTVAVQADKHTVTVTVRKTVPASLAQVLTGKAEESVSATATAALDSVLGRYPYALFAGGDQKTGTGIRFNGNNIFVYSDIHSNDQIMMRNAKLMNGATATAVGDTCTIKTTQGTAQSNAVFVDMPNLDAILGAADIFTLDSNLLAAANRGINISEIIAAGISAYEAKYHTKDYSTTGLTVFLDGNLIVNGAGSVTLPINIVVSGNIIFNGSSLTTTAQCPANLISTKGDITFNGSNVDVYGIIFAPLGDITMNGGNRGSGHQIHGSLIAQSIWQNGGHICVTYDDTAAQYLPAAKVHLIS